MMLMDQLPLEPRARASDPDTAHQAAAKVKNGSKEMNDAILLAAPRFSASVSAFDIAHRVGIAHNDRWDASSVRTAVSRLHKKGLLIKADEEGRSPRGQKCARYRLP